MNNKGFTVHINFIKGKEFIEKNEHRVSDLYLDFFYYDDYYEGYTIRRFYRGEYYERFILATLYTSNESLMEEFKNKINSLPKDIYAPYNFYPNSLLISKYTRYELPILNDD